MLSALHRSPRAQRHVFVWLALFVLVLSIDVLGLLGVGDPKGSAALAVSPSKLAAWKSLDENARQMLDKEHEAVVSEIRVRIEQEHLLFTLKFGLVGAILWAFLQTSVRNEATHFERTPFAALAAWSAVVAAAIVDLRVTSNQTFLMTLGGWARQYEQLALGSSVSLGWEAFLADNLFSEPYYPALRVSGQILTALLFCVTAFVFLLSVEGHSERSAARISGAGAIVSITIMTVAAITIRRGSLAMLIYVGAGVMAAVIAGLLSAASHETGTAEILQ